MNTSAENLTVASLQVAQRDWPAITSNWAKWFKRDFSADVVAMGHFSMAILIPIISSDLPELKIAVRDHILELADGSGPAMCKLLDDFENAYRLKKGFPAKYSVPPLDVQQEALAIAYCDSIDFRATQSIGGIEYYNLATIGLIGGIIMAGAIETRKMANNWGS